MSLLAEIAAHALDYKSAIAARSPLAWYKLDETSGSVATDSSGHGNNGTYIGAPTLNQASLGAGIGGKSVLLNGSTQNISAPSGLISGLTAITVLAWILTSGSTSNLEIVSADADASHRLFQFRSSTGGTKLEAICPITSTTDGATTMNGGGAHMAAFTWFNQASGTVKNKNVYLDGVVDAQVTVNASNLATPDAGFWVGSQRNVSNFWNGRVQEVAIFGSALTAAEIAMLYALGR